jgi:hypothetical protein
MANSLITCAYTLTAVGGQSIASLAARFAAVPLDLTIPRTFGLLPVSDTTAAPSGQSVTRTMVFQMTPTMAAAASVVVGGGAALGKITSMPITVPGNGYAKPPIASLGSPGTKGQVHVTCEMGGVTILQPGSGYSGATTVQFVGGDLGPKGVAATGTPIIAGGHITGVTLVTLGNDYHTYPDLLFTDSGGGSGASGVGVLSVFRGIVDNPGNGYSNATPVTLSPVFPVSWPDASASQGQILQGWMLEEFQSALQTSSILAAAPVVS